MTDKNETPEAGSLSQEESAGVDSKFRLVLVAASRAEQLIRGARPKLDAAKRKATRLAMDEMAAGMVDWGYGPPPARPEEAVPEAGEAEATEPPAPSEVH